MPRERTQSERVLDTRLQQLEPGSLRHRVMSVARAFRASWADLGATLSQVAQSGVFTEWGYADFASYCQNELSLRRDTVQKLVRSFDYVQGRCPEMLEQKEGGSLPSLAVVDLLARAQNIDGMSQEDLTRLHADAFSDEQSMTRSALMAKVREVAPDAFRRPRRNGAEGAKEGAASETPIGVWVDGKPKMSEQELYKTMRLAERLHGLLTEHGFALQIGVQMSAVLADLKNYSSGEGQTGALKVVSSKADLAVDQQQQVA